MKHRAAVLIVCSWMVTQPLAMQAQGLADVARREEARRKTVKVPGKVYTNDDLKPDPLRGSVPERPVDTVAGRLAPSPAVPGNAVPANPAPETAKPVPASAVETPAEPATEGEAYWKALITGARSALERSRVLADALQSRVNALATDIVNRDDPAQRAQLELERQRALAELDRMKTQVAEQTTAIADIEEDARKAGVPPGWLR